jgi:hypothetical protein
MTRRGGSPAAKRRSASRRSAGHEYDPGRALGGAGASTRARWASSARWRALVRHPAPAQARVREATKSRPARRAWNPALRCAAQSHTVTP